MTERECEHCGTPLTPNGEIDFPRAKQRGEEEAARKRMVTSLLEELRGKETNLAGAEQERENIQRFWAEAEPGRREWELSQVEKKLAALRDSIAESERVLALYGHVVERAAPHEFAEKRPGRARAETRA